MNIGEAICTSKIRAEGDSGWAEYKAPDGQRFVFLLLGTAPIDGSAPLVVDATLERLGFVPKDQAAAPRMAEALEEARDLIHFAHCEEDSAADEPEREGDNPIHCEECRNATAALARALGEQDNREGNNHG